MKKLASSDSARLVYIMGRGHSGSTILDTLLGNAEHIESIGELVSGIDRKGEICSCGAKLEECEFWNNVSQVYEKKSNLRWKYSAVLLKQQAHIRRFLKFLTISNSSKEIQLLKKINKNVVESILEVSNKKCVVDSSKEHTRALFLLRFFRETKIIHLVRNPNGILASDLYRLRDGMGFKFLRHKFFDVRFALFLMALSSINWVVGQIIAEILRWLSPERVMRIRYEDLCSEPMQIINSLSQFIGHDLQTVIKNIEAGKQMSIGHNIGGNMMRKAGTFIFNPIAGKSRSLPRFYKILVHLIAWPFMLKYGYLARQTNR